ncbi:MAG: hypothetical protein WCO07_03455 [bacterium]
MKKLFFVTFILISIILLPGCGGSYSAKCHLICQGVDIIVDADFTKYEIGDTLFLSRKNLGLQESWEIAKGIFQKDTVYIFWSVAGPYEIAVAKAVITKKF